MFEPVDVRTLHHRISRNVEANSIHVENVCFSSIVRVPRHENVARVQIRMMRTTLCELRQQQGCGANTRIAIVARRHLAKYCGEIVAFLYLAGSDVTSTKKAGCRIADKRNHLRSWNSRDPESE